MGFCVLVAHGGNHVSGMNRRDLDFIALFAKVCIGAGFDGVNLPFFCFHHEIVAGDGRHVAPDAVGLKIGHVSAVLLVLRSGCKGG